MHPPTRRPGRFLVPLLTGLVVLFAWAPVASALSGSYPVQSLGNRGSDVRALQYLLREDGRSVVANGVFGASAVDAVVAHQQAAGLPASGVVDEATWRSLTPTLEIGSRGQAVRGLQRLLNDKRRSGLTVDGEYGKATRDAVAAFQRHMGATASGRATAATWQRLLWHFERPVWGSTTGLCDYSVGNGTANWGTAAAIGQLEAAAKRIYDAGHGRVAVGDLGFEHGGDIPGHISHERGLDVDLRPMRVARNQCAWGGTYRLANYDRAATRALVKAIRATAPGHVKLIYFNDPVLIREGLTTWYTGHDDHLHVRYCEAGHALKAYRCPAPSLPMPVAVAAPEPQPRTERAATPAAPGEAALAALVDTALPFGFDLAAAIRAFERQALLAP